MTSTELQAALVTPTTCKARVKFETPASRRKHVQRPYEDHNMTRNTDHSSVSTGANDELFSQGWLDRHIDAVMSEMATWPADFRPQLTGRRAEAMRDFDWSKYTDSRRSETR